MSTVIHHELKLPERGDIAAWLDSVVKVFWTGILILSLVGGTLMFAVTSEDGARFDLIEFITGYRVRGDGLSQIIMYLVLLYRAWVHLNDKLLRVLGWFTTAEAIILACMMMLAITPTSVFVDTGPSFLKRTFGTTSVQYKDMLSRGVAPATTSTNGVVVYSKAYLYTAPDGNAKMPQTKNKNKQAFLVEGNRVTLHSSQNGFTNITWEGRPDLWVVSGAVERK